MTRTSELMMRIAWLVLALAGIQGAAHAQDLPRLSILPVTVVAGKLVGAGNGKQFTLGANTSNGFVMAGLTPVEMNLPSYASDDQMPDASHFILGVEDRGPNKKFMSINLVATTRRCILTTIDPVLNQASETGRVILISSTLLRKAPFLHKASNPVSLCTMDSGKLALYFSTPTFDMVRLTTVSYGTPSNLLRSMSSQSIMLSFPDAQF